MNTPSSFTARSEGKDWDDEKREWIFYNLQEEASLLLNMSDEDYLKSLQTNTLEPPPSSSNDSSSNTGQDERAIRPVRNVHDLEYYQTLDVPSNATPSEIKKAYYKKARDNHPDKHPNDPEAHAKFQVNAMLRITMLLISVFIMIFLLWLTFLSSVLSNLIWC